MTRRTQDADVLGANVSTWRESIQKSKNRSCNNFKPQRCLMDANKTNAGLRQLVLLVWL